MVKKSTKADKRKRQDVLEEVVITLSKYSDGITITENTEIPLDLEMDSLDVVETIISLEEKFWITFDDDKDMKDRMSVGYLVDKILEKQKKMNNRKTKTKKED